ncbi:type II secretion system secretin GspD [Atopomonas hussainii]|uniref:type II secretion system secretin GspD n=1 Tax=Atopomonas hussainii TaxID=1429083 RepID=UPI0009F810D3|nr:type II secretion system secretin GspD [Atopomonas hussainii]
MRWGVVLCALLFCATLSAEEDSSASLDLDMRDADIRTLIEWVADQTGKNIVIDPRVKGKVTVVTSAAIAEQDLDQLLSSVLSVHGFALIKENNVFTVVPETNAKSSSLPVNEQDAGAGDSVVKLFKLNNVSAVQLVNLLKPMVPQSAYIAAYPDRNYIIVADRAVNIAKIDDLVERLDKQWEVGTDVLPLSYANAQDILTMVNGLFPKAKADTPESFFSIGADVRTNSILVAGDEVLRRQVREVVKRLDRKVKGVGNTKVFYLHYLRAADTLPVVQSLSTSIQKQGLNAQDNLVEVNIQASEATNALVVTGPPDVIDAVGYIIDKLDIRRAQVLVEAVIVEVSESEGRDLGIEWRTSSSAKGGDGWYGGTLYRDTAGAGAENEAPNLLTGMALGFYRNGSLRGLFKALETSDALNILSKPNLVTLDNEEAKIVVGQNVPFVTGRSTSASSPTDNPFQTIERKDVGITLTIKPQVNEGDAITLDITQEISSVSNSRVTQAQDIITNTRSVKTRVLVEDGQTLVLGGLISDELQDGDAKVPFLGNVPIIGALFRSEKKTKKKNNLMVFIQPRIIRSSEDAQLVTGGRYRYVDETAERLGYGLQAK